MAHDVFVSYSTADKATADAVCATLERAGVRCWIAPRDVLPGMNSAGAIIDALHQSRLLILVFSAHSNTSPQVMQEVERAASKGIPILPFRIEVILPSDAMEYFLGSRHWLDAMSPPLERHLQQLASTVGVLLEQLDSFKPASRDAADEDSADERGQSSSRGQRQNPSRSWLDRRKDVYLRARRLATSRYRWPALAALLALLMVIAVIGSRRAFSQVNLTSVQLFNALLASPVSENELPPGFSPKQAPYARTDDFSSADRRFHAIGEVEFSFSGPDWSDATFYTVFPSAADARGSFDTFSAALTPDGFRSRRSASTAPTRRPTRSTATRLAPRS